MLIEKSNLPVTEDMRKKAANLMSRGEWAQVRSARVELSDVERESELRRRQKHKRKREEVASTGPDK